MVIFILKIEHLELARDTTTSVYETREKARQILNELADECEAENDWIDEPLEAIGDYERDEDCFYLVDTLRLSILERFVN